MILPVIMAGGVGSRLWPLSREHYPKQFLRLHGKGTMLQNTLSRLDGLPASEPLIICGDQHRFLVTEQFRQAGRTPLSILCEPVARGTAPAVALAALQCLTDERDPVLLVLPADHVIDDEPMFRLAVERTLPLALQGKLVTFGIVPAGPETGYGYIERGEKVSPQEDYFTVSSFIEKPDRDRAQAFINTGRYYWNSGIFMFRASRYLEELKRFRLDILSQCQQALERSGAAYDTDFILIEREAFSACPADSVDCAVMEKTAQAVVVPLDAGWSDVGAWDAVWQISDKDCNDNVVSGDVVIDKASGCYVRSEGRRIAVIGADDLVIVDTPDAVLIAGKKCAQHVKSVSRNPGTDMPRLQNYGVTGGDNDVLSDPEIRRIVIQSGDKISRQSDTIYSCYIIVLSGEAQITSDNKKKILSASQSLMFTRAGEYTIENDGGHVTEVLEIIFHRVYLSGR